MGTRCRRCAAGKGEMEENNFHINGKWSIDIIMWSSISRFSDSETEIQVIIKASAPDFIYAHIVIIIIQFSVGLNRENSCIDSMDRPNCLRTCHAVIYFVIYKYSSGVCGQCTKPCGRARRCLSVCVCVCVSNTGENAFAVGAEASTWKIVYNCSCTADSLWLSAPMCVCVPGPFEKHQHVEPENMREANEKAI